MTYFKPLPEPKPERRTFPSDLSDAQWALLEPLLPVTSPRGQQRIHSYREIVNGILYVLRNGIAWDAIPHDLPPKGTVYDYFRDWTMDGTWKAVHYALADRETGWPKRRAKRGCHRQPATVKTSEKGGLGDTTAPRRSSDAGVAWSSTRKAV